MTGWKKFGTYGSKKAADKIILFEEGHNGRGYEYRAVKEHVGKSVDPAYSDKDGNQWIVQYRYQGKQ